MKKKYKKNNKVNPNQKSFYFEDYLETNKKYKKLLNSSVSDDRIYFLFFLFLSLILIFSFKIIFLSFQKPKFINNVKSYNSFISNRRDIVDRNGEIISRNIQSFHAAIKPNLIKDKQNFLIKIRIIFPEIPIERIQKSLDKNKYFYLKKRLTEDEKKKLWSLGEKGIVFESFQRRVYPQGELFSHILGQIDSENFGISGIEKNLDKDLKNQNKIFSPLALSLDSNLQFIVKEELKDSMETFNAVGSAGLLMNASNGEILSLVSLPDFNINKRENINHKSYMNKITMGVYELGSIFKTFTLALALNEDITEPQTIIKNIPNKIKCSIHEISDIKKFPNELKVEDILIRSSNIGTLMIARQIGEEKFKNFLDKININNTLDFELDEVGTPINFEWEKCKLETVSYGHGITTTPIQATAAYASLTNGGHLIKPTLLKNKKKEKQTRVIKESTSLQINNILRKVVTDKFGTASLADIFGYNVGGKTGTSQYYKNKNKNINTFISTFSVESSKFVLLVLLDDPKVATDLIYNYRGKNIKGSRNEAGWNSVYVAGKIIEKIGPILAINNKEFINDHVVKKPN